MMTREEAHDLIKSYEFLHGLREGSELMWAWDIQEQRLNHMLSQGFFTWSRWDGNVFVASITDEGKRFLEKFSGAFVEALDVFYGEGEKEHDDDNEWTTWLREVVGTI